MSSAIIRLVRGYVACAVSPYPRHMSTIRARDAKRDDGTTRNDKSARRTARAYFI